MTRIPVKLDLQQDEWLVLRRQEGWGLQISMYSTKRLGFYVFRFTSRKMSQMCEQLRSAMNSTMNKVPS